MKAEIFLTRGKNRTSQEGSQAEPWAPAGRSRPEHSGPDLAWLCKDRWPLHLGAVSRLQACARCACACESVSACTPVCVRVY